MGSVGPYTPEIILANIRTLHAASFDIGVGHCLEAMRKVSGVDSVYGTATLAGDHAGIHRVSHVTDIPANVYIYWGDRAGHIAWSLGVINGVHRCFTPGSPKHPNLWRNIPTDNITAKWNHGLRGWSKTIDGETIK